MRYTLKNLQRKEASESRGLHKGFTSLLGLAAAQKIYSSKMWEKASQDSSLEESTGAASEEQPRVQDLRQDWIFLFMDKKNGEPSVILNTTLLLGMVIGKRGRDRPRRGQATNSRTCVENPLLKWLEMIKSTNHRERLVWGATAARNRANRDNDNNSYEYSNRIKASTTIKLVL